MFEEIVEYTKNNGFDRFIQLANSGQLSEKEVDELFDKINNNGVNYEYSNMLRNLYFVYGSGKEDKSL